MEEDEGDVIEQVVAVVAGVWRDSRDSLGLRWNGHPASSAVVIPGSDLQGVSRGVPAKDHLSFKQTSKAYLYRLYLRDTRVHWWSSGKRWSPIPEDPGSYPDIFSYLTMIWVKPDG